MTEDDRSVTIGEAAARTGLTVPTLRAWEQRYGFPRPARTEHGVRVYDASTCRQIDAVVRARREGLSLAAAIRRVVRAPAVGETSLFAAVHRFAPHLPTRRLGVRAMRALSTAVEDQTIAYGSRAVVLGAFQRAEAFAAAQPRWDELARTAPVAAVFADFDPGDAMSAPAPDADDHTDRGSASAGRRPERVPLDPDSHLRREWAVVSLGPELSACLAGWEQPADAGRRRCFEAVWTTSVPVVRHATEVLASCAAPWVPDLADRVRAETAGWAPDPDSRGLADRLALRAIEATDRSEGL